MAVPQQSLLAPGLPEKPDERQARLGQQAVFKRVVNLRHPSAAVTGHGILGVDVDQYKQPAPNFCNSVVAVVTCSWNGLNPAWVLARSPWRRVTTRSDGPTAL